LKTFKSVLLAYISLHNWPWYGAESLFFGWVVSRNSVWRGGIHVEFYDMIFLVYVNLHESLILYVFIWLVMLFTIPMYVFMKMIFYFCTLHFSISFTIFDSCSFSYILCLLPTRNSVIGSRNRPLSITFKRLFLAGFSSVSHVENTIKCTLLLFLLVNRSSLLLAIRRLSFLS